MTAAPRSLLHRARKAILVACVVLWICAFIITHSPREKFPGGNLHDNELHGLGYFVLGCVFWLTLAAHGVPRRRRIGLVVGVLAAYALLDEITQPLAGRQTDVLDWIADVIGAILAALACKTVEVLQAVRHRKSRKKA